MQPVEEDNIHVPVDNSPQVNRPLPNAVGIIEQFLREKRIRLIDLFLAGDKDKSWTLSRQEFKAAVQKVSTLRVNYDTISAGLLLQCIFAPIIHTNQKMTCKILGFDLLKLSLNLKIFKDSFVTLTNDNRSSEITMQVTILLSFWILHYISHAKDKCDFLQ